jgi:hypothetical protein
MNRQAAQEQADRIENLWVQNFLGSGTGEALPGVEKIGDDKNREDRGLGDD